MHPRLRQQSLMLAAAIAAACPSFSPAQVFPPLAPVPAPAAGPTTAPDASGIYLPDSAAAAEKLRVARNLEKAGDWARAADAYQELLEQFPDKVLAGEGSGYLSVPRIAISALCRWPAEAASVYRGHFEPAAQALLAAADPANPAALLAVSRRYFLTTAGTTAALRAIELYWSRGELAEAARCADELLELHPDIEAQRPLLLYQLSLARHLLGDSAAATRAREQLQARYPDAHATIAGQEVTLAADLPRRLAQGVQLRRTQLANWPMFGGSPSRAAVPPFAANINARLYSVPLPQEAAAPRVMPGYPGLVGAAPELLPVVDRGQMFLSDGNRIGGVSLDSGGQLPGWPSLWITASQSFRTGGLSALAVTERSVLAVTGGTTAPAWLRAMGQPVEMPSLCRIDRNTGVILRRFSPAILPERFASLRAVQLTSALLVADGRIYLAARGGKNTQIDDAYLLCLDEETLECCWATYLVSGPSGANYFYDDGSLNLNPPTPQIALAGGRLVVATNLGAIAAVDAATGSIAWIQTYTRNKGATPIVNLWQRRASAPPRPAWADSPPILLDNTAIVLPSDSDSLLLLDAESGQPQKRLPLAAVDNAVCLAGVDGDQLVLAAPQAAWCINWRKLAPDARNLADATTWNMRLAPGFLRGRPFLTTQALYLATDKRLFRIGRDKWKVEEAYPAASRPWPAGEGPGNLLVTADHVAVVGSGRLNVYASLSAAEAQLEAQAKASPASPEPVLRLAELSLAGADFGSALKRLQRAAPLVESRPAASDRLHAAAESTWRDLLSRHDDESRRLAAGFVELAKQTARSPQQRATLWWRIAENAITQQQYADALDACDHLLSDDAARQVLLPKRGRGTQPAWLQCHFAIQAMLKSAGRDLYATREAAANARFAEARAAADPLLLDRAARQFSSATGAPAAMLDAARLLRQAGRLAAAADLLRDARRLYADDPAMPTLLEESARLYCLTPGRLVAAAGLLRLGAETLGNPKLQQPIALPSQQLAAGTSFLAAAVSIERASRAASDAALPDFGLAIGTASPFGKQLTIPGIRAFLPIEPHQQRDDYLVLAAADGSLSLRRPGTAEPLFTTRLGVSPPEAGCWLEQTLFAWSRETLLAVDAPQGKTRWRLAITSLPPLPPALQLTDDLPSLKPSGNAAPQPTAMPVPLPPAPVGDVPDPRDAAAPELILTGDAAGSHLLLGTDRGRIAALDPATGKLQWQVCLRACTPKLLFAWDQYSVVTFTDSSPLQLAAFDNSSGQLVYLIDRSTGQQLLNFDLAPSGRLVFTLPGRLCARDLFDSGDGLAFDVQPSPAELFSGMSYPAQLAVVSDRIVAVTSAGRQLSAFSLQTGKPVPIPQVAAAAGDSVPTFSTDAATLLVAHEPAIYSCSRNSFAAYNLEVAQQPQRRLPQDARDIRSISLGQQHVILFDAPAPPAPPPIARGRGMFLPPAAPPAPVTGPAKKMRVLAYSRAKTPSGEVGRLDVMHELQDPAGITECNAVQGGIVYITGDNILHFLPGAAGHAATQPAAAGAQPPANGAQPPANGAQPPADRAQPPARALQPAAGGAP